MILFLCGGLFRPPRNLAVLLSEVHFLYVRIGISHERNCTVVRVVNCGQTCDRRKFVQVTIVITIGLIVARVGRESYIVITFAHTAFTYRPFKEQSRSIGLVGG